MGSSGCRLCHTRPSTREGESVYPHCPQCVCDKWGVNEAGACAPGPAPTCTSEGEDPWATGVETECCAGTSACLGDWEGTGRWFYLCKSACGSAVGTLTMTMTESACSSHVTSYQCNTAASDGCVYIKAKRRGDAFPDSGGCRSLSDPRTCPLIRRKRKCNKSGECLWESGSCKLPAVKASSLSPTSSLCEKLRKKRACRRNGCTWQGRRAGGCTETSNKLLDDGCAAFRGKRACKRNKCKWLGRRSGGCAASQ